MKQRIIALLLALALTLSLCAVSALAGEEAPAEDQAAEETTDGSEAAGNAEDGAPAEEEEPLSPAGPDTEPEIDPETGESLTEAVETVPDEVGTVTFANVERRMREKNLQVLVLEENIQALEVIDYDKLEQSLRETLNDIADAQWGMITSSGMMGEPIAGSLASQNLQTQYDAVREQFDAIRDGEMQEDNAATIRQLKALQDQIVIAGEALYVAVRAMDIQEAALQRQLDSLNRTVEEMELRYQMGQISALQLSEVRSGRTALVSGLETLRMNIRNYKLQLEMLIGAEQTGEIQLGPVPEVTEKQLGAMDLETDLLAAKEKSYDLYAAARTLEDAQEDYKESGRKYGYNEKKYEFLAAKHSWQAAQYTYNNTIQDYELKFRTLYAQVNDYKQIWDAAKTALACQQDSYASMELKYQQGTISKNALLDAEDDLREAEEKVRTSANDLFSSYNTYCWAVQHGVLN